MIIMHTVGVVKIEQGRRICGIAEVSNKDVSLTGGVGHEANAIHVKDRVGVGRVGKVSNNNLRVGGKGSSCQINGDLNNYNEYYYYDVSDEMLTLDQVLRGKSPAE